MGPNQGYADGYIEAQKFAKIEQAPPGVHNNKLSPALYYWLRLKELLGNSGFAKNNPRCSLADSGPLCLHLGWLVL